MDVQSRIEQFKNMTAADPDNELGHFSLGKAYVDAQRYAEAEPSLGRVLELNPTYSKAYQLLGEAQLKLGKRDDAVRTLKQGYEVAAERGDVMPRDAMAKLLVQAGEPIPASAAGRPIASPVHAGAASEGFHCSRCGRPHGKMPERPFKGPLGERVWANVCAPCWREWIGVGTKVINEMGLQLADPRSQAVYDEHLKEFLQLLD